MKEKWIADFSKPEKACFAIKSENAYNAYLEKGALVLDLKQHNGMAQIETLPRVYVDHRIDAHFRFDGHGGYCAAGIMFRITGQGSYYLALISSKGEFRLDAVHHNIPHTLIGWMDMPSLYEHNAHLEIIAKGDHFIFLLNGKWIAEAQDASFPGGHLGFALVSYEADAPLCQAWLDSFTVDAGSDAVAAAYAQWSDALGINAESRLRLAENFAALDNIDAAYNQILKSWKQREDAAKSVTATYTEARTPAELLFAARMAIKRGQFSAAEEYLNTRLAMDVDNADTLAIAAEMAKILCAQDKNESLIAFLPDYIKRAKAEKQNADIPPLYALLGNAYWNLHDYKAAAKAWGKAFSLDGNNALYKEAQTMASKMSRR